MTSWSTIVGVARYHLIQRPIYLSLPWALTIFSLAINLVIASQTPTSNTGGLLTMYSWMFVGGLLSTTRSFPFGLTLGVSRRSYYLGTTALAIILAAGNGAVLTALHALEGLTDGWGVGLHFFRVPYILDGPWYLTWLTSFVGIGLLFVYGMWFGIVHRRWNLTGLVAFLAGQMTLALAVILAVTWTDAWAATGRFFTDLSAAGLTGVLAVLTAALFAGGFTTIRRATV
ncbi:ABC transporter permease [Frankia sp. Cpl3]|nr:ABC transporter permease [Frankia sp. Cpl3]